MPATGAVCASSQSGRAHGALLRGHHPIDSALSLRSASRFSR